MSLPEEAAIRFDVQVATLKRVHSSWLPGVPIDMLTQARKLALGHRWLARRLTVVSPVLFGRSQLEARSLARLRAVAWIAPLVADPWECALDLGSLAMAAELQPTAVPAAGDLDMVERLIRRGAAEFAAFADYLHPAWGESVRLTYERAWWIDAGAPSLSRTAAHACLRQRIQHPALRARPGVSRQSRTFGSRE